MFHHALCITDDGPAVRAAVDMVMGSGIIETLLGPDSAATIEITPLPEELNGRLVPATTAISFAVDDLDERVAACRAAGLAVTVAPGDPAYAVVTVAGLDFELVQFAP